MLPEAYGGKKCEFLLTQRTNRVKMVQCKKCALPVLSIFGILVPERAFYLDL